jgi:hypothetical protein
MLTLSRSWRTIDNLADSVDRFALATAAADNEHLGDQVEVRVIHIMLPLPFTIFSKDDAGNADRLPAVAAQDSSKMGGPCNGGH